jgi:putative hydrolase of the HAD superfamily
MAKSGIAAGTPTTALWWDIGGVILTNAWDRRARRAAAQVFHLEPTSFEARHAAVVQEFECGRLTLDAYVACVAFDEPRSFTREEFIRFMYAQSTAYAGALSLLRRVAASRRHRMVMCNNESRELNRYRIERFQLAPCFDVVCSSCFLGLRKPDERFYRLVLDLLQVDPAQCLLIDDRLPNLESAAGLGIRILHCRDVEQLTKELAARRIFSPRTA